jgi:hypothetical protein
MEERKVKIYVLKNPENGIIHYVGRTLNEKSRYRNHIYQGRNGCKKNRKNSWVNNILNKGLKPTMEIIEIVPQSKAIEREMYWISELKKTCDLKNERDFIENDYLYSEESRKKMSESQKGNKNKLGKNLTPEQKNNCGNARRGKKQSREEKIKRYKPILEFDLDGNFIIEWESASDAAKAHKTSQSSVSLVASGKRNSWFGIIWKYKKYEIHIAGC